jgi:hypothetical protein
MANNMMYGISALDPRVAATDKFIQDKQIPPDQVEDFLLSMGADPKLASLVFKYRKVQEAAKNQQQAAPSTTNVDQDISNQYAQLKQQQRGIAAMSAPAIANAPMRGGITGQPVQQMAGGGPVAFGKGGRTYTVDPEGNVDTGEGRDIIPYEAPAEPPQKKRGIFRSIMQNPILRRAGYAGLGLAGLSALFGEDDKKEPTAGATVEMAPEGLSDEAIKLLAAADAERPAAGAGSQATALPAAPRFKRPDTSEIKTAIAEAEARVPKSEQEAIDAEMKMLKEAGAFEGIEARRKQLAEQKEKATTSPEKKFWLAFAQAGFAASAKGARNLWETLSMGGVEGMKVYEGMKEKEKETLERIADRQFQLDEMLSNKKLTATQAGRKKLDDARRELQTLRLQSAAQEASITNAENMFGAQIYGTQAQITAADRRFAASQAGKAQLQKLENQYYADIAAAQRTTDPKLKAAYLARAEDTFRAKARIEQAESGYQSAAARIQDRANMITRQGAYAPDDAYSGMEQVE